jgi:3-oxoacyl-[acyl-carrier-protein] synthase III
VTLRSVITGTGSCIPERIVPNKEFENSEFFETQGSKIYKSNKSIIEKFEDITGIYTRRYAATGQAASDLGYIAAAAALQNAGIDIETLDYIIVAHNFGDVADQSNRINTVPSLASRIKAKLKIQNPDCVAYDIAFGCPGWIEGIIQADYYIRSGDAKRCLVVAAETLSRVIDPHDRDSMIYADGSGAVVLESSQDIQQGIIAHKTQTFADNYASLLSMGKSYSEYTIDSNALFLKMNGRKVYEFALSHVPQLIRQVLEKCHLSIQDVNKVLIHQANRKMDHAILERLFSLYNVKEIPADIMPMTIGWLGNSSVATVPTLLDLMMRGNLDGQQIHTGDIVVMASVGAGMNINAIVYKF